MANTFKKFLALVLVLSLVMGMTGMAYAADDTTEDAIEDVIDTPVAEDEIIEDEPLPVDNTTESGIIPTEDGDELETSVVEDVIASNEVATTAEVATADELNAALANNSITLIKLTGDIEVSEQVDITRDLRLNGGGKKLTYTNSDADANTHISALHVYGAKVLISDLSIIHNTGAALIVNDRADVTVDKLTTSAAGTDSRLWGGVNVDGHSRFTAYNLTCNEVSKVWSEDAGKANGSTVSIDGFVTVYGVDGEKVHFTTEDAAENNENIAAQIGDNYYGTLQAAITAAGEGQTVTLLNDATESVVIASGKEITLDLNGNMLTGAKNAKGEMANVITNRGILTIKDSSGDNSGTVMGGTDTNQEGNVGRKGIAVVNEIGATCTIESGTIKRGDDGTFGNYTVQNKSKMYIKGGLITNNSNKSNLVVNYNRSADGKQFGTEDVYMEISGGTVRQTSMSAIKNEPGSVLHITGEATVIERTMGEKNTNFASNFYGTVIMDGGTLTTDGLLGFFSHKNPDGTEFAGDFTITGDAKVVCNEIRLENGISGGVTAAVPTLTISGNVSVTANNLYQLRVDGNKLYTVSDNIANIDISGGTFNKDVIKYVIPNYKTLDNNNGTWTVVPNYVARAGANDYMTIAEALNQGNPLTVTLLRSTTENVVIPEGKTVTLDLGGNTLTGNIQVLGTLTLENGTVSRNSGTVLNVHDGGALTIADDAVVTSSGGNGIAILSTGADTSLDIYGTVNAFFYGVSGNANATNVGACTINVYDGATITSSGTAALYLPNGNDTTNITGGTMKGVTGISIRGGKLNVSGDAKIVGDYTFGGTYYGFSYETIASRLGNGNCVYGPGIVAIPHSTLAPIAINLSGGEVEGYYALAQHSAKDEWNGPVTWNISGGKFTTTAREYTLDTVAERKGPYEGDAVAAYLPGHTGFVSGGHFSTDIDSTWCSNGYRKANSTVFDGYYTVSRIPTTPVTPSTPSTPDEPDEPVVDIEDDPTALGDRPFIFEDVHEQDWFYDDVKSIFENGLINGTTTTTYEPQTELTRGMIVTILWRIAGEPTVEATSTFADVPENAYYFNAINWGAANNIARGYDEETFAPDRLVSREELAAFIYRYSELIELDLTGIDEEAFAEFGDAESVLPWFVENMKWAISAGIVKGEDGMLLPQDRATRAEAAAMVNRFIQMPEVAAIMQANAETEAATDAE